ncbi:MAG: glycosyltransferase family 2 protein [Planctomycetota bacterium]|jgi:GT2 family glycosyltransferase
MTLSIVIVNYNTKTLLRSCLESIYTGANGTRFDVRVADNNSHDGSVGMLRSDFPQVKVMENDSNLGFSKANNKLIAQTDADYILLLNPDTFVVGDAIGRVMKYMEARREVGICGCRVLNTDRTVQLACRRSIPTPKVAFFHLSGLSKLFPNSKTVAKYNLTYLDPDQPHEVGAVSGAFLMIRREAINDIGLLDERFFMYGEELDWCLRAKRAGWSVVYYPEAEIIHHKGKSTRQNSRKATLEFYRAMYLFHKKHFAKDHSPVTNLLIYIGIVLRALFSWRRFFASAKTGSSG